MKSSLILIIVIVVAIVVLDVFTTSYLHDTQDVINEYSQKVQQDVREGNWQKASDDFARVEETWQRCVYKWSLFLDYNEIEPMDEMINDIRYAITYEDEQQSIASLSFLEHTLTHLISQYAFGWSSLV